MQEPLNRNNESKVADSPQVAEEFSTAIKGRLGIESADIQSSNTLRVVQNVTTTMRKATEAIQQNSEMLSNVISKEQRNMFANFFKQLRQDTREGEESFLRNQEKFLTKIAQLQVSVTKSLARSPEDKNLMVLLRAVEEIKTSFVPENKSNLWKEIKGQLFTPLKREHFREDSFIRRAFFNGSDVYGQKMKRAQSIQKVNNALEGIEGDVGLEYDTEKNKYVNAKQHAGSNFKQKQGKNFRAPSGAPMPPNTVQAAGVEPNKKILEDSVAAVVALGKKDRKKAREDVLEAMKNGANSVQEVIKAVFAEGNRPEPPTPAPAAPPAGPVLAELNAASRIKYNDVREADESPYVDTDPNALAMDHENVMDYLPSNQTIGKTRKRARQLGSNRGGIAGPDLFNAVTPDPGIPMSMESGRNITDSILPEPTIGEKVEEKIEKTLEESQDTLEDIAAGIQALIAKEGGLSSGSIMNPVAAAPMAARVGSVAAPALVAAGGLAGGFLLGEGVNKMLGQQTATSAIMESRRLDRVDQDNITANTNVAKRHGYGSWREWHDANVARQYMRPHELAQASAAAAQAPIAPPPAPIIVQAPPAPPMPVIPATISGGVRPTDPTFLRYQDKRWSRTT